MSPIAALLRRYVDLSVLTQAEIAAQAGFVAPGQRRASGKGHDPGSLPALLRGDRITLPRVIRLATVLQIPDAELCAALRAAAGIGEAPCA